MDCREFEDRLDVLQAGLLSREEEAYAEEHIRVCARCRALLAAVRGECDSLTPEAEEDLTTAIMSQTTGTACFEAENILCDSVDGVLGRDDQEILSLHLAHCRDCGSLAETLAELRRVLPEMATLEPDAQFTADVLRVVSAGRRPKSRLDLSGWWYRLIRRPRFAWEAAYVGTLLLLLALGNPAVLPTARAVPQMLADRGDRWLQGTASVLAERQIAAEQSVSSLGQRGKSLLNKAATFPVQATAGLKLELASWLDELKSGFFNTAPQESPRNNPE